MASYDKSKDSAYTRQVQQVLSSLGADLGAGGIDGKWGAYTQAAYEANKAAVDAALYGSGGSQSAYQSAYQSLWDSMPQLSYTYVSTPSYSYEYYYSIGDALEAANYEKQKQQAQTNLENAQAALQESVKTTKANVEKSTTARGFGRSSYATDALQATDLAAMNQGQALLADFDQTLMSWTPNATPMPRPMPPTPFRHRRTGSSRRALPTPRWPTSWPSTNGRPSWI